MPYDRIKGTAFLVWWARDSSRLFTWLGEDWMTTLRLQQVLMDADAIRRALRRMAREIGR